MKEPLSSSYWVHHPAQVRFLLEPLQRRYLEPFVGKTQTVLAAASEMQIAPNTLLRAVQRMVRLGLLTVANQQQRKGRSIKHYRSSAEVFFLPHTALPIGGLEEAMAQVDLEGQHLLRQNIILARSQALPSWGFRMFRHPDGMVYLNAALDPYHDLEMLSLETPAAFSGWFAPLYLDFAEAKELQRELFALAERYRNKKGSQRYLLRLGMAPLLKPQTP